ncbi:hypothetical protein K402DRAFT_393414 [Aulographum hederae CBS 113979]|uniref:Uncharacterized protein n=1 Tax=Aulographum hederae CBS 113979 TaxID=1176131 RepID=A0A6G1H0Q9_9PEZI|nr:hypothetical protein K402DRAFT_393414 [Aulographum hederae CBS 113979]
MSLPQLAANLNPALDQADQHNLISLFTLVCLFLVPNPQGWMLDRVIRPYICQPASRNHSAGWAAEDSSRLST